MRRTDVLRRWGVRFLRGLCVTAGAFFFSLVLADVAHASSLAPERQPGTATERYVSEAGHGGASRDGRAVSVRRLRAAVERLVASAEPRGRGAEKAPNRHPWTPPGGQTPAPARKAPAPVAKAADPVIDKIAPRLRHPGFLVRRIASPPLTLVVDLLNPWISRTRPPSTACPPTQRDEPMPAVVVAGAPSDSTAAIPPAESAPAGSPGQHDRARTWQRRGLLAGWVPGQQATGQPTAPEAPLPGWPFPGSAPAECTAPAPAHWWAVTVPRPGLAPAWLRGWVPPSVACGARWRAARPAVSPD
jgi:hypothetical protein